MSSKYASLPGYDANSQTMFGEEAASLPEDDRDWKCEILKFIFKLKKNQKVFFFCDFLTYDPVFNRTYLEASRKFFQKYLAFSVYFEA